MEWIRFSGMYVLYVCFPKEVEQNKIKSSNGLTTQFIYFIYYIFLETNIFYLLIKILKLCCFGTIFTETNRKLN